MSSLTGREKCHTTEHVTPLSTSCTSHSYVHTFAPCCWLGSQVDEMEGLGSALKLPASVIQEAGHLLREVSCWAVGEVS